MRLERFEGDVREDFARINYGSCFLFFVIALLAFSFFMVYATPLFAAGAVLALIFLVVSFFNLKIGFAVLVAAFLLSPEINVPIGLFHDITFRFEDFLLIMLLLAILGRIAFMGERGFFVWTPLNAPIILYVAANVFSSLIGALKGNVNSIMTLFYNLKLIEFFLIFYLVISVINNKKQIEFFINCMIVTAIIIAVYASFQIPQTEIFTEHRLTAPFEGTPEPNTLGAYLAVMFVFAFSFWLYSEKSVLKNLCILAMAVIPLPLLFTLSRGAYLLVLVSVIVIAATSRKRWIILLLLAFLLSSPFILPQRVMDRALYNFRDPRYYGFIDQSSAERIFVYQKAWYNLKLSPLIGHGVTYLSVIDSQYARIMIETGLIGVGMFVWLIIRMIKVGLWLFRMSSGWERGLALAFVASVTGLSLYAFGAICFCIVRIMEPFWVLAGLVVALYLIKSQELKQQLDGVIPKGRK